MKGYEHTVIEGRREARLKVWASLGPARPGPARMDSSGLSLAVASTSRLSFVTFVLQREIFKLFDEDSHPREDKIIHTKLTKPRRENIPQQGYKGRKDRPFEFSEISLCGLCDLAVN